MDARLVMAAATTAVAGVAHVAAGAAHAGQWYAAGFLAMGAAQLLAAGGLWRGARRARAATVVLHLGPLAAWARSRTVGLPGAGEHPVGVADTLVVALQVTSLLLVAVGRTPAASHRLGPRTLMGVSPALLLVLAAGGMAVADVAGHRDEHVPHHHDVAGHVSSADDHAHDHG